MLKCQQLDHQEPAVADARSFNSVKLPAALVSSARESAVAFRRSTAGQIEYWAILGKAVEDSGLTISEARAAIDQLEAKWSQPPSADEREQTVNALTASLIEFSASGALAQRVREVVQANANRAKASQTDAQAVAANRVTASRTKLKH